MDSDRLISTIGPLRIVRVLGGLLIVLAVGRLIPFEAVAVPIVERLIDAVLLAGPGIALLYAGHWLHDSELRPDVFSRVAMWCLGGLGVMLGVSGLMLFNPGGSADEPYWAMAVAGSLGALGGLGIGIYNAQALSRAREAEQHRDKFRAERDLREQIFETSPVGIGIVNADRSIRNANERAAEIIGAPVDDLLELEYDESLFEATDADGNPLEEGVFQQVLRTGERIYDAERQITRPDGRQIWLSVNGAPLRDSSGEITAVILGFEEITERKQLEEELKETVDRLERSNDRLRQFAYAASHDLQEPLRMISSYLQLLEDQYEDDLDTDAREYMDFAIDGADRMREMIEDLLAYSRIDRSDPEFEQVDCDAVLNRVLSDLHVQIEETDAEIEVDPLPLVVADENQLEQLFQNLISNAIKYRDDEPPRIEITAEQREEQWKFCVADNGIGIDSEHTDRIFEVFKRLHTDDEYTGTGVGLSLCDKIIAHHGGTIWVESEPGDGSTFYFTLPQQMAERQQELSI